MKEYTAVESANLLAVISEVNKLLADGWEVSGSIAAISVMGAYKYCQPMIREKKDEQVSKREVTKENPLTDDEVVRGIIQTHFPNL